MANLKINPKLVALFQQKVDDGLHRDADEGVLAALEALEAAEERYRVWLRREVQVGLDALDRGESIHVDDLDAFFEMIKERAAERCAAGIPINDAVKF
jgi:Arc/MetJ-type ribon-helix-helix transcriptional regulator